MKRARIVLVAAASLLFGALMAPVAHGVVACGATGEVTEGPNGTFLYTVSITWDFAGFALPEEINLVLPTLDECEFYNPGNPIQALYVVPMGGVSEAQPGCYNVQGMPVDDIAWVGAISELDEFCGIDAIHLEFTNTGSTPNCLPLSADTGLFTFTSYGVPAPSAMYYDAIVIRSGDICVVCDYEGPMPECNMWAPVESLHWGTIKALYR